MGDAWRSVGPGDLVAVLEPPGPAWAGMVAGAWDAGAALLPVDARLTETERDALLARARPTHAYRGGSIEPVLDDGAPVPEDTALVVATSGTSGRPKPVELTRAAVEAAVAMSAGRIGTGPWLACMPPAHIGGLLVFLRALLGGQPLVVHERFDPERVLAEPDVEYLSFVPTMLHRLVESDPDLGRYGAIVLGGAGLPADLRAHAEALGGRIVTTYGLTESTGGVVYDGSPLEGAGMRVLDDEVHLHGPTLMRGYRGDDAATAAAFTDDGWLRTGDAGFVAAGVLHVTGRTDEVIQTGAEKVWPLEVEAVLRAHPGVEDVAVTGRSDAEWGERVVAVVVPRDRDDPPSLDALRAHARETLAGYKLPRELVLAAELPRTSSGKVRRARLLH